MSGEHESFIRALREWALTDEGYARALHEIEQLEAKLAAEQAEMFRLRLDHLTTLGELQEAGAEVVRLRAALQLVVGQLEEGFPKSAVQQFAMDVLEEHLERGPS